MQSPFDTPTARPSNPITDALSADPSVDREPLSPASCPSPPRTRLARPALSNAMKSYDNTSARPSSRMSQNRQNSAMSPPRAKADSIHSSASYLAKSPRAQARRNLNDSSRRGSSSIETQNVSFQAKQPQAHDFQGPTPEELVRFALLCRRQYYDVDAEAARKVGEILAKLPPSSVAIYSRTMANVRSEYHRDKEIERRLHVETTLASILPGSTIKHSLGVSLEDGLGGGVAAMRSKKARHARHAAFKAFVDANCVKQIPGCHPFFRSLFGALWLQSIDPGKGGAGSRRVEWEVDVAVFTEAGGGESWAREAVEALKGVLGMSERVKETSHSDTFRSSDTDAPHPRASEDLTDIHGMLSRSPADVSTRKEVPEVPPHRTPLRTRAPSDPFSDSRGDSNIDPTSPPPPAPATLSPRIEITSPDLSASTPFLASPPLPSPDLSTPISPIASEAKMPLLSTHADSVSPASPRTLVDTQIRVFSLPSYLTNAELRALCRVFPEFIASRARVSSRFRSSSITSTDQTRAQKDAGVNERGRGSAPSAEAAKVGHGELRIGSQQRDPGWRGTWWQRFIEWFRALLS